MFKDRIASLFVRGRQSRLVKLALVPMIDTIGMRIGVYKKYKQIDFTHVKRFVFVCTGNVCRSPYAEAVTLARRIPACSFGIDVRRTDAAPKEAVIASRVRGYDLSGHLSKNGSSIRLDSCDCIVAMDVTHLDVSSALAAQSGAQVTLLGLWGRRSRVRVPDPFGKSCEAFSSCYEFIDDALDLLLSKFLLQSTAINATEDSHRWSLKN